ncbi:AraC family transcriptional regulator [Desulfolucanica intricata]|uniref:AraC family transcriptional regulator n=1 Tax=Desulfolucanica intricata TaxID=1285191 RepID=UPI000835343F|nr:AraC family transcriptional regulator [Desulfolucanica intricata]
MNLEERWQMYSKIQGLKKLNLKISQIARHIGVTRNTVYKYIDMTPGEYRQSLERRETRKKKLDNYKSEILGWLKTYPDLSTAQVYDWLKETYSGINVCERTVGNLVNQLRKEHAIPKTVNKRQYEAIPDLPMGYQVQVDFGEKKLKDPDGILHKLWFIAFVIHTLG